MFIAKNRGRGIQSVGPSENVWDMPADQDYGVASTTSRAAFASGAFGFCFRAD